MKMQLMGLISKYPKLLGLSDLATLRSNQLDITHLTRIADAFGTKIPVTEETANAIVALLKGRDIQTVADMFQSPESIQDVVVFFTHGVKGLSDLHSAEPVEISSTDEEEMAQLYIS